MSKEALQILLYVLLDTMSFLRCVQFYGKQSMDSSPPPTGKKKKKEMGRREMTVQISCYILHVTDLINTYHF